MQEEPKRETAIHIDSPIQSAIDGDVTQVLRSKFAPFDSSVRFQEFDVNMKNGVHPKIDVDIVTYDNSSAWQLNGYFDGYTKALKEQGVSVKFNSKSQKGFSIEFASMSDFLKFANSGVSGREAKLSLNEVSRNA